MSNGAFATTYRECALVVLDVFAFDDDSDRADSARITVDEDGFVYIRPCENKKASLMFTRDEWEEVVAFTRETMATQMSDKEE